MEDYQNCGLYSYSDNYSQQYEDFFTPQREDPSSLPNQGVFPTDYFDSKNQPGSFSTFSQNADSQEPEPPAATSQDSSTFYGNFSANYCAQQMVQSEKVEEPKKSHFKRVKEGFQYKAPKALRKGEIEIEVLPNQQDRSYRQFYCSKCQNHEVLAISNGSAHKKVCPYENCTCSGCLKVNKNRSLGRLHNQIKRGQLPLAQDLGQICSKCRNHNLLLSIVGTKHKKSCKYFHCTCEPCLKIEKSRSYHRRSDRKMRRERNARSVLATK